jgi:hypothetical protein
MWLKNLNVTKKTNYLASQIDIGGCKQNASKLSSNNCVINSWWKISRKNCLRREEA